MNMDRREFLTGVFTLLALLAILPKLVTRGYATVPPGVAKHVLQFNTSPQLFVMCRGYNEDDSELTELVWEDDSATPSHISVCGRAMLYNEKWHKNRQEKPKTEIRLLPHCYLQNIE